MIADSLSNWRKYNLGAAFEKAFKYVEGLKADSPLGRFPIEGEDIYASVFEYSTSEDDPEFLEVHRKYIDLQVALSGSETLGWLGKDGLAVKTPYDPAKDCEFLNVPNRPFFQVEIDPKRFAIFLPDDAHVGKLPSAKGPMPVKKVVVKIAVSLLGK